ncbi:MAG: ATP-binding protein [Bacillota bacterium]
MGQTVRNKTREQMAALIKINNLTGFMPSNIDDMLTAVKRELDIVLAPYECRFSLIDENNFCGCGLAEIKVCKALKDQLPMIVEPGQMPSCCKTKPCAKGFVWHVCVPLIVGTEILGVVTVKSDQEQKLCKGCLELLLAVANQVASTIQRTRLFNRLMLEKSSLEQANREITQLNLVLKKTIQELEEAQAQLKFSERLAATGQLAANLAHEINNPTGIILSRLEWLLLEAQENSLPEKVIQDLETIKKHTARIGNITRGLLSFSRKNLTGLTLLNLGDLIKETVDWLAGQFLRGGIQFNLKLSELPLIQGSSEQLQQVLVNLFTNARDAMPQGGKIIIETHYLMEQDLVQVDIKDTGIGIAKEVKPRIFDPFFTTKEKKLGTGLGLSISFNIIEGHGGTIKVESQVGQGSCFSIILPCHGQDKEGNLHGQ